MVSPAPAPPPPGLPSFYLHASDFHGVGSLEAKSRLSPYPNCVYFQEESWANHLFKTSSTSVKTTNAYLINHYLIRFESAEKRWRGDPNAKHTCTF